MSIRAIPAQSWAVAERRPRFAIATDILTRSDLLFSFPSHYGGRMDARHRMKCILLIPLLLAALPARADIRATVVEKTYAISGTTGMALYQSIGARGPILRGGASSAIAKTDFDLKWGRDYKRDGNDCVLAVVRPFLTITYTLPKPSNKLPPDVAARWRTFIAGIKAHEAVHGQYVTEMAQQIYDTTLGFRQPDDPNCKAIRNAIQTPLKEAFARYKARNRAFEQAEMAAGGNIQGLILKLINGR